MQNFIYALIQVIHNFGAVTVVGTSAFALCFAGKQISIKYCITSIIAMAWAIQAVTGILFGASTYYFEGHLPDIHGVAIDALRIKIFCALSGFVLALGQIRWHPNWSFGEQRIAHLSMFTLSALALSSAAFLRWFS